MGRFKRLGINTGLIFLGTSGSKLITFLMLPLYTRWLNVDQYGAVDLVTTYSTLLLGIISLSIFDSVFIFPKGQSQEKKSQYFSSSIIFGLIATLFSIIICTVITKFATIFRWEGFFITYIWQIFTLLITSLIQQIVQQFNRSIDKMNVYAFVGLVQTVGIVSVSFFIIPKYKVNGYIGALIVGNIISIIYSLFAGGAYKYFALRYWDRRSLIEMLKYSIPIIPNGIMWFFVNSINRPLLEGAYGLGAVGLLAIANKIPTLVNQVYMIFQNAFIISAIEESTDPAAYQKFYNQTLKLVVIVQTILISIVAICGKWIIQVFTTVEYFDSWIYIPPLLLGVLFTNIATFVGVNFTITRRSKYFFYSTIWAGLSALVLNLILIPKFAIWGACAALIVSQIIGMISRIKYSWSVVHITNYWFYSYNFALLISLIITQSLTLSMVTKVIIMLSIGLLFVFMNREYIRNAFQLICQNVSMKI